MKRRRCEDGLHPVETPIDAHGFTARGNIVPVYR